MSTPVRATELWNLMPRNFDLSTDYCLNFGCYGYDYYYHMLQQCRLFRNETGPCAIFHYASDDIWKVFTLKDGLVEGNYIQNGGIPSPTLYAQYHQGYLHGYRIIVLDGGHRIVSRYHEGRMQFYYRQSRNGHVYEYHGRLGNEIIHFSSPKCCLHCIISRMKHSYQRRHKR